MRDQSTLNTEVVELLSEIARNGRAWIERGRSVSFKEWAAGERDWSAVGTQLMQLAQLDPDECERFSKIVEGMCESKSLRSNAFMMGCLGLAQSDFVRHCTGDKKWEQQWSASARDVVESDDEGGDATYTCVELEGGMRPTGLDQSFYNFVALETLVGVIECKSDGHWSAHEIMEEYAPEWGCTRPPSAHDAQVVSAVEAYAEARALDVVARPGSRRPAVRV